MIYNNLNRTGQIEEIKTKNDKEIVEVYGGIGENNPIYYKKTTMEGVAPLSFKALGQPLTNYTIYGAGGVGDRTDNLLEVLPQYLLADNWQTIWHAGAYYFMYTQIPNEFVEIFKQKILISGKVFLKQGGIYLNGMVFVVTPEKTGTVAKEYHLLQNNGNVLDYSADVSNWENIYLGLGYGQGILTIGKQTLIDSFFDNYNISLISGTESPDEYEPYGYKIPIACEGTTTNIYRNKPICNESLNYSETEVQIPTTVGQNTLSVGTVVQPNQVTIKYKEPAKIMQGVAPLTFISDGSPLVDYTIYGDSGGVGERTENIFPNLYDNVMGYLDDDGQIKRQVTYNTSIYVDVLPSTNYTFRFLSSYSSGGFYFRCALYDVSLNFIGWGFKQVVSGSGVKRESFLTTDETAFVRLCYIKAPASSDAMLNVGTTALPYEPYGYKIPVTCGGVTTNIYLDSPLYEGDSISFSGAGVKIPTVEGENTLTVGTTVQPSNIEISYKEPTKTLTGSLPLNFMSDGSPLIDYVIYDNSVGVGERTTIPYEPYGYKIPIGCGDATTNIYLNAPLYLCDSITFSVAQTTIPTTVGHNTLSIGTTVQPSKVSIEGNIKI